MKNRSVRSRPIVRRAAAVLAMASVLLIGVLGGSAAPASAHEGSPNHNLCHWIGLC
jgi:hypothetical protein